MCLWMCWLNHSFNANNIEGHGLVALPDCYGNFARAANHLKLLSCRARLNVTFISFRILVVRNLLHIILTRKYKTSFGP